MSDERPVRSGIGWVLLGVVVTLVLHVVASVVVAGAGAIASREGGLVVIMFWATLGLAQWVYLLPAGLIASRLGFRGVAQGIWISGGLVTLLAAGCWGLIALK